MLSRAKTVQTLRKRRAVLSATAGLSCTGYMTEQSFVSSDYQVINVKGCVIQAAFMSFTEEGINPGFVTWVSYIHFIIIYDCIGCIMPLRWIRILRAVTRADSTLS